MNEDRALTVAGVKLIQHYEGCLQPHQGRYKSYLCPAGVRTIGYGSTGPPHGKHKINASTIWTLEECDQAFVDDMGEFERGVRKIVAVDLNDDQYSALVSFAYNCGLSALKKSTLLKKVNAGDFEAAAREFVKWNKAGGKVMAGLTRRRKSEALMFRGLSDEDFDGVADDPMPQAVDEPDRPDEKADK